MVLFQFILKWCFQSLPKDIQKYSVVKNLKEIFYWEIFILLSFISGLLGCNSSHEVTETMYTSLPQSQITQGGGISEHTIDFFHFTDN